MENFTKKFEKRLNFLGNTNKAVNRVNQSSIIRIYILHVPGHY